jgi:hypothetical protein
VSRSRLPRPVEPGDEIPRGPGKVGQVDSGSEPGDEILRGPGKVGQVDAGSEPGDEIPRGPGKVGQVDSGREAEDPLHFGAGDDVGGVPVRLNRRRRGRGFSPAPAGPWGPGLMFGEACHERVFRGLGTGDTATCSCVA